MDTNDLDYVKSELSRMRPIDWEEVATLSGVPLGTLRKIAYSEVEDPRFSTVKRLADYFRDREAQRIAAEADRRKQERRTLPDRRAKGEDDHEG
jgi:predicted transcriptional regulator